MFSWYRYSDKICYLFYSINFWAFSNPCAIIFTLQLWELFSFDITMYGRFSSKTPHSLLPPCCHEYNRPLVRWMTQAGIILQTGKSRRALQGCSYCCPMSTSVADERLPLLPLGSVSRVPSHFTCLFYAWQLSSQFLVTTVVVFLANFFSLFFTYYPICVVWICNHKLW